MSKNICYKICIIKMYIKCESLPSISTGVFKQACKKIILFRKISVIIIYV